MWKQKVSLLDSTLREGEQSPNILFTLEEKIELALLLEKFGVEYLEIGHPGISQEEEFICKEVVAHLKVAQTLVHARAQKHEIDAALRTHAKWVGIWLGVNEISLKSKYTDKSQEWVFQRMVESIEYAFQAGLKIRLTIEDASRTPWNVLAEAIFRATQAGAQRISLADTVGAWNPTTCYEILKKCLERFSCEFEVHLHNDLGLALANAWAALEAGVNVVDVTCLGVGERAGICDLFSLASSLNKFTGKNDYQLQYSKQLAQYVSRAGSTTIAEHQPIVGKNVFTHSSKYHVQAISRNTDSYEFLSPSEVNRERSTKIKNLTRQSGNRFTNEFKVSRPFIKGASELLYHKDGVGVRWVLMDHRLDNRSVFYIISRVFSQETYQLNEPHVDKHAHHCDSLFVFQGFADDGSGLNVSVTLGDVTKVIQSPASIYIQAYIEHSYTYISGTGTYLNIVLSPEYNNSLV